jgi:phosphate:Na+ symporter
MLAVIMILFNFLAGSFLIVFGVHAMGKTLEHANSKLLKNTMQMFSKNRWASFLTGIFLTGLVQSGTAVTILTIGFVDSGVMQLESAVGVIYGANIGTTFTAQLMSFNISQYAWYVLIAGCVLSFGPVKKLKTAGNVLAGVGLMFSGLNILSKSVVFISDNALIAQWLQSHSNNLWLCLLTGLIVTMLVQSSSATVGLTILLFNSGLMPFGSAVALTLGDNIGSCITAQIASLRSGTAGKRTAWAHTLYNVIGVVFALIFLPRFCTAVLFFTRLAGQDSSRLVANTHTIFNILSAMIFLPFSKYYVKFLKFIIPERGQNRQQTK